MMNRQTHAYKSPQMLYTSHHTPTRNVTKTLISAVRLEKLDVDININVWARDLSP